MLSDCQVRPAQGEDLMLLCEFQVAMARESEDMVLELATVRRGIQTFLQNPDHLGMTDEHYKLFEWLKSEG